MALVTTRATAVTYAKRLLGERGSGLASSTVAADLCDEANRIVYQHLANINHEFILQTATFTWAADSETHQLTTETKESNGSTAAAPPMSIVDLGNTPSSGSVTRSNRFNPWRNMNFRDRYTIQRRYDHSTALGNYHYCMVGDTIYVAPIPAEALNCHITYIGPLTAMTADGDTLLAGKAHRRFGHVVGAVLAQLLNASQHKENPAIDQLVAQGLMEIETYAQSRAEGASESVRVTRTPWE